ncbi:hypothetical protein HRbin01_00418 [archaeon HR01]|nr:hypothetical protein HRbin01_00418 [archaeon HR01]
MLAVAVIAVAGLSIYFLMPRSVETPKTEADIVIIIPKGASQPPEDWASGRVVDNRYYNPAVARVVLGINNTVKWINLDEVAHTVTSVEVPPNAQGFDSGVLGAGSSFVTIFSKAGRYEYYCQLHPWAGGVIDVS